MRLPRTTGCALAPSDLAVLERFAAFEHGAAGLAAPTVRDHRVYLTAFLSWWRLHRPERAGAPVPATATGDLAAFLVAEAGRGLAARTRRAQVASLRRFFGWLVLTGRLSHDPAACPRCTTRLAAAQRRCTAAEVGAVLAHLETLTGCAASSGTRSSRRCVGPGCARPSCARCIRPTWT